MYKTLTKIIKCILVLATSFVLSYSAVMDNLSPFGIAFVSALPFELTPFGIIGAAGGYILSPARETIPLRYIATLISFAVIRGALKDNRKMEAPKYTAVIAAFVCAATGLTIVLSTRFSAGSFMLYTFEALLTGGAAYFFKIAFGIRDFSRGLHSYNPREASSLAVSGALLLLSLSRFELYHINLTLIASAYLLITICMFAEKYAGCFAGSVIALILALGTENMYILPSYLLGAVMMTVFAPTGMIGAVMSFVAASLVTIPVTEDYGTNIIYAIHALLGSLFFILSPEIMREKAEEFFESGSTENEMSKTAEEMVGKKLESIGKTISDISSLLSKILGTTENMYPEDVTSAQLRGVVSKQIADTSLILMNVAEKIRSDIFLDTAAQGRVCRILSENEIRADSVLCTVNSEGLMFVDISCPAPVPNTDIIALTGEIGEACERVFELPLTADTGDDISVRFFERPCFKVSVGAHQITSTGAKRCGDYYSSFLTADGKFYIVLSDGMGTGSAAALGSALSVEVLSGLLKEGVDFSCALSLANSAVMINSGDESLATVDIACIDTYSGKADFYKAGAAATLVRHGKSISKLDRVALPIGILRDVEFSHSSAELSKGDIILMSSDGIWIGDELRIAKQLSYFRGSSMDDLAERIAAAAFESENVGSENNGTNCVTDDITVIAARVEAR